MFDTPLDPRPCKSTPLKTNLCVRLNRCTGEGSCVGPALRRLKGKGVPEIGLGCYGQRTLASTGFAWWAKPSRAAREFARMFWNCLRQPFARNPKASNRKNFHPQMLAGFHTHQEQTTLKMEFEREKLRVFLKLQRSGAPKGAPLPFAHRQDRLYFDKPPPFCV